MDGSTCPTSVAIMGVCFPGAWFPNPSPAVNVPNGKRVHENERLRLLSLRQSVPNRADREALGVEVQMQGEEDEEEEEIAPVRLSGAKPAWCMLTGGRRNGHREQREDEEMDDGVGHSFAQQLQELNDHNWRVKLDGGNGIRRTGLVCPSRMTVRAKRLPDESLGEVRVEYVVTHWNHPVGVLNAMNASVSVYIAVGMRSFHPLARTLVSFVDFPNPVHSSSFTHTRKQHRCNLRSASGWCSKFKRE